MDGVADRVDCWSVSCDCGNLDDNETSLVSWFCGGLGRQGESMTNTSDQRTSAITGHRCPPTKMKTSLLKKKNQESHPGLYS